MADQQSLRSETQHSGCVSCATPLQSQTIKEPGELIGVQNDRVIFQVCMNMKCPRVGLATVIGQQLDANGKPIAPPEAENAN